MSNRKKTIHRALGTQTQFRMRSVRPKPIRTFDDSDLVEFRSTSRSENLHVTPCEEVVAPQNIPMHLMMLSLLEQLCLMYVKDNKQGQQIFVMICDQLSKMKIISPLSALDELSSIRSQDRLLVHNMIQSALMVLPASQYKESLKMEDIINIHTSRYRNEFQEISRIGKGGFGSVFKARHKLDGRVYALKRVTFKHSNSKPELWVKILREVKALANLQHPNIVGYNAAWLEYESSHKSSGKLRAKTVIDDETNESNGKLGIQGFYQSHGPDVSDSIVFDEETDVHQFSAIEPNFIKHVRIKNKDSSVSSSSEDIRLSSSAILPYHNFQMHKMFEPDYSGLAFASRFFQNRVQETESEQQSVDVQDTHTSDIIGQRRELHRSVSEPMVRNVHLHQGYNVTQDLNVVLYIQMELCSLTLKEWMQERNLKCSNFKEFIKYGNDCMRIFRQILKGVEYIHLQGLIHRDLKPRNIFLQGTELSVKIGDFGLAKDDVMNSLTEEHYAILTPSADSHVEFDFQQSDHTSGVGTSTYAAPEQLRGSMYDNKCDIYSLGILLYEEFSQFHTEMERLQCLDGLRKGEIPEEFQKQWPTQTNAILKMTSEIPIERPSAKELLQSDLFLSKYQLIASLQKKLSDQEKEITKWRRLLEEKEHDMEKMKVELKYLTNQST